MNDKKININFYDVSIIENKAERSRMGLQPTVFTSNDFSYILDNLGLLEDGDLMVRAKNGDEISRIGVSIEFRDNDECYIVRIRRLDKTPIKVINDNNSKEAEKYVEINDDESFVYDNIFVWSKVSKTLTYVMREGRPGVSALRAVLQYLYDKHLKEDNGGKKIVTSVRYRNDFYDLLDRANEINTAVFKNKYWTPPEDYRGDIEKYRRFAAGEDFETEVKLKAKKGKNLKSLVLSLVDGSVGGGDEFIFNEFDQVILTIDGQDVALNRHKFSETVSVKFNGRNIVEEELIEKLCKFAKRYKRIGL